MRDALNLSKSSPGLSTELVKESDEKYVLHVKAKGALFGPQPFLTVRTSSGGYLWENFDRADERHWTFTFDENHVPVNAIGSLGVAANSPYGTAEINSLDVVSGQWRRKIIN
jgi:hypothetical protein